MKALTTATNWTFTQKIFFRFFFVYFFLICFPFPLDEFEFTRLVVNPYYDLRNRAISQTGNRFLFNLLIATLASLLWSVGHRRRTNYEKLDQWLRFYLRFYFAYFMFQYGFSKVFLAQRTANDHLLIGKWQPMKKKARLSE